VLDGVLCLHAASSEGYELVVKLLIEQGVDVNASGHRDISAPIVGTSQLQTDTNIVRTPLLYRADRADKHSVSPEMLARQDTKEKTAEVFRESG